MVALYHNPVLLEPSVTGLVADAAGTYVDVTFGGGGHSRAILQLLSPEGRLLAFDQDPDAQRNAIPDGRFTLIAQNFRHLQQALLEQGITQVDGILADLGVSSHQFDTAERGFSYRADAPLDMRMDTTTEGNTAADVLNTYPLEDLVTIFRIYGELPQARKLANAVVWARQSAPVTTTAQLAAIAQMCLPKQGFYSALSQVFQALRIEVNDELAVLRALLLQSLAVLKPGGRLAVISYHSLEDRLVKHFFATGNLEGEVRTDVYGNRLNPWQPVTRKPIVPDQLEIDRNPRARSAKLRIAQKIKPQ
jgi:16S rRNA (cytosine1402-N4)-methyltransferase